MCFIDKSTQPFDVECTMPQPVSDLALKVDKLRMTIPPNSILATKEGDMTTEDRKSLIAHPSTIVGKMLKRLRNAHLFDTPCSETVNFNTLPTEIKLKVYEMTWETRRVRISRKRVAQKRVGRQWMKDLKRGTANAPPNEEWVTTSCTRPPVTLWVNYESRSETLKRYQLSFACPSEGTSHVYFNFDIDELEIPRHCRIRPAISREELARLRVLVVPSRSIVTEALWDKQDRLDALEALWPAADDTIMGVASALGDITVNNAVDIRAEDINNYPPLAGSRRRVYGEAIESDFYFDHTNPTTETVLKPFELRAGQTTIVYHSFDRAEAVVSSLVGIHLMVQDIAAVWQGVMGDVAHVFGRKVSLLELQDIFHHTC
ncbi:hypothetical protein VP1G_04923 [Cytospora mali]|uniref:2EXR domain-containing protein n=1 Tax=Cytospora mali TaxID=578113 RepID=A0A194V1A7_CYTMA|nr:hypothetical protein VP1G_04923 [Valsa mali var. pyri (nom. inval.)]